MLYDEISDDISFSYGLIYSVITYFARFRNVFTFALVLLWFCFAFTFGFAFTFAL